MLAGFGFVILSCSFLVGAERSADSTIGFGFIVAGTAVATAFWPVESFRAVSLLLPLVFGLGRAGLLAMPSPELLMFCAFGVTFVGQTAVRSDVRPALWGNGHFSRGWTVWFLGFLDLFVAWTMLSFIWWLHEKGGGVNVRTIFSAQAIMNYSDLLFPRSDTLFWLTGWVYFRVLLFTSTDDENEAVVHGGEASPTLHGLGARWLKWILFSWTIWTGIFLLVQLALKLPEGFAYNPSFLIPTGMFNDPHSMGSVSAALGLGLFACACRLKSPAALAYCLGGLVMMLVVAICYSRAAWFATIASLALLCLAWRPRLALVLCLVTASLIGLLAWRADYLIGLNRPYLTRMVYLVRLDRLPAIHEARLEVYRRAPAMIAAHPFFGHGPGSTRVASSGYVSATDLWGADFMHDTWLQVAVEQGIPAAILFSLALFIPLIVAARNWASVRRDYLAQGAAFAAVTYLLTQLTSNSLNIYIDQQFLYWTCTCLLVVRLLRESAAGNGRIR
jgi:O-antigen ligase